MRGSWGSCGLGPDPGFGPRRVARAAAALEGRDDVHAPAAGRAWRAMVGWRRGDGLGYRVGRRWRRGCGEQLPGAGDVRLARGAGEEPVVADAVEALGQDVEQEAPDELVRRQRHGAVSLLPVATVVLVSERDVTTLGLISTPQLCSDHVVTDPPPNLHGTRRLELTRGVTGRVAIRDAV